MLSSREVRSAADRGAIRLLPIRSRRELPTRSVYLHPTVHRAIIDETGPDEHLERMLALRADLDRFSSGGRIPDDARYLKLLRPHGDGIWEIKSYQRPPYRLLGMFARRDVFIGLAMAQRGHLGRNNSREWRNLIATARHRWNEIFGASWMRGDLHAVASGVVHVD